MIKKQGIGVIGIGMLVLGSFAITARAEAQTTCPSGSANAICGKVMSRDASGRLTPMPSDGPYHTHLTLNHLDQFGVMVYSNATKTCAADVEGCVQADGSFVFDLSGFVTTLPDGVYDVIASANNHTIGWQRYVLSGSQVWKQIVSQLSPVVLTATFDPSITSSGGRIDFPFSIQNVDSKSRRLPGQVTFSGFGHTVVNDSFEVASLFFDIPRKGAISDETLAVYLSPDLPDNYSYCWTLSLGPVGYSVTQQEFCVLKGVEPTP